MTTTIEQNKNQNILHIGKKLRRRLSEWMTRSEDQVIEAFSSLKDAKLEGKGDQRFVFIPGTRDDRILLVAHADTVFDEPAKLKYSHGVFSSAKENIGIGADDRAGCAMLWELRNSGHSLLLTNGEESGCIGARFLNNNEEWDKIINAHRFAIEMDRMNDSDMAFYHVGSNKFKDWCEDQFKGYKRVHGSHTDICILCNPMCGMNISVGYYNQHWANEHLKEQEWMRTLEMMYKVLKQKNLPRFEQDPKPVWTPSTTTYIPPTRHTREYNSFDDYAVATLNRTVQQHQLKPSISHMSDDIIVCIHDNCHMIMDITEYRRNHKRCTKCNKEF
jgi:hypothetical protein